MHRKELNERSPLRVLEQSIHGGLGRGNLGVVMARHGVGKTAFLVGVALDDLMRGRKVLHVSLEQPVDRVLRVLRRDLRATWRATQAARGRLGGRGSRSSATAGSTATWTATFSAGKLREALAFMREHSDFAPGHDHDRRLRLRDGAPPRSWRSCARSPASATPSCGCPR